jgi:hypothetical protein
VISLVRALSGGAVDPGLLEQELSRAGDLVEELALLWECEVGLTPAAPVFSASWERLEE